MRRPFVLPAILLFTVGAAVAISNSSLDLPQSSQRQDPAISISRPPKTMRAFRSEAELKDFFRRRVDAQKRAKSNYSANGNASAAPTGSLATVDTMAATPAPLEEQEKSKDESVTNTQHAGVDEGGIVKIHGDHLVILRRGRLFTVRVSDNSLSPVASVDAFAPGINPRHDWYDEMLVSDDTVVVVGYSYERGGTEINLFDISRDGALAYRSTYHLRSNDYYSSRNYASRLIGNKLIFYTPQYLGYGQDPVAQFPAVRRWHKGVTDKEFRSVVAPTDVYRAERPIEDSAATALHTVTVCDLSRGGFDCSANAVLGAPGRVFYVSPTSVFVWTTDWQYKSDGKARTNSMLYRLPLDASPPNAIGVVGSPVDQFSFLESDDKHLNVLVRSDTHGEQMWGSEVAAGDVALFRLPVESFNDGSLDAPSYRYREMPKPDGYTFQNRFVGNYVLYGTGSGWGYPERKDPTTMYAVDWVNGDVHQLPLGHGADRIEQMGRDSVVIGTNGRDLFFSPIRLDDDPEVRQSFIRKNAAQGEVRSHGFFYKPISPDEGVLGLPIARAGRAGYRHLFEGSAAVTFLRNKDLEFTDLGELEARNTSTDDGCRASCVDWYGNARPLFLRNRVFALLGYEIVEGALGNTGIRETRRINFAPRTSKRSRVE